MKVILITSLFLAATSAAPSRIINGKDAAVGQFPYQISFQYSLSKNTEYTHLCGGTIISPTWVLTAGHCIVPGHYKVKAGITLLWGDPNEADAQVRDVIQSIVHPDYDAVKQVGPNDIALLQIDAPFSFNDLVQKLNLPAAGDIPTDQAVLSGWGSISTTIVPNYPFHLQYAYLPVITFEECVDTFEAIQTGFSEDLSIDSNICTGADGNNLSSCRGDSGGPLVQGNTIIGVVSWGLWPCGNSGAPSVYTRVSGFIEFINEYVNDL